MIATDEPLSLAASIGVHNHGHNTRSAGQFRPVHVRTELGKRMFDFSGPTLYNALPRAVREGSASGFKRTLRKYLLNCEWRPWMYVTAWYLLTRNLMGEQWASGGFPSITQIRLGIALGNFQYLSEHQFYASSKKIGPKVTQGQKL